MTESGGQPQFLEVLYPQYTVGNVHSQVKRKPRQLPMDRVLH